MSKVRINDLAKELEIKSRAILDILPELGVAAGKTHSSSLEGDEAEKVRARFSSELRPASNAGASLARHGAPAIVPKIDLSHISKPGDVLKAIQAKKKEEEQEARHARVPAKPAAPPEPPAAPEVRTAPAAPPAAAAAPARPEPRKIVPQPRQAPPIVAPPAAPPAIASHPPSGAVVAKPPVGAVAAKPAAAARPVVVVAPPPAGAVKPVAPVAREEKTAAAKPAAIHEAPAATARSRRRRAGGSRSSRASVRGRGVGSHYRRRVNGRSHAPPPGTRATGRPCAPHGDAANRPASGLQVVLCSSGRSGCGSHRRNPAWQADLRSQARRRPWPSTASLRPALTREARVPSIPHALPPADSRPADRQVPAHGPVLALDPALAHAPASAHGPVPEALHRRRKRSARNALHRAAAAVARSSIPRPKKAR